MFAQNTHVPTDSKITLDEAAQLINNFHIYNSKLLKKYPESFLINIQDPDQNHYFKNYLVTNDFEYLHIYFAELTLGNPSTTYLELTPADYESGAYKRENFDFLNNGSSWVFNSTQCPCNTVFDGNMDVGTPPPQPNQFNSVPETLIRCDNGFNLLSNFQNDNPFSLQGPNNNFPQSVLLRIDKLINNYLLIPNNQDNSGSNTFPSTSNVQYLHIYIGLDLTKQNLQQQITLVTVGVDGLGNHVYYYENGVDYVFEEVLPCPECATIHDDGYDYKDQIIPSK